ncbi:MAG TPA: alpha-glucan family phosphorylase, partial [Limnochordia bacterium]
MLPRVAYFCMEFGLHDALQIYAGGLGVLAGDLLKSAGARGAPLVGVGILWRGGYTKQVIGEDGWSYDERPQPRWDGLEETGVEIGLRVWGKDLRVKVWQVRAFGNAPLYLLDADLPQNTDRWITRELYGGGPEARVSQEIVLGVGGVRALRALSIPVDVYHFNEGHAVLAGLELIREKMAQGMSFERAWAETRGQIVFTTHTPVMAGNEAHPHELLERMGASTGFTREQLIRIGGDPFNMTAAGLRLSRAANAVSRLHERTARTMWAHLSERAPIDHVTNGVHRDSWQDPAIRSAYAGAGDLWGAHRMAKRRLLAELSAATGAAWDDEGLLIGFARRATAYKRADLIFRRPERIEPLLKAGRLRLLFAGKPHPHDHEGKRLVQRLVEWSRRFPDRIAFWPDYDMRVGRLMTQGCDLWLNTPRRPLEASGTSGM